MFEHLKEKILEKLPKSKLPKKTAKPIPMNKMLRPNEIRFGYQKGTSKKDLIVFLEGKARGMKTFSSAKYNILKRGEGYYWEVHDSGSGHGCLKSIIAALENGSERVVVHTSSRPLVISKKRDGKGISALVMDDNFLEEESNFILHQDSMKPFVKTGNTELYMGIGAMAIGILSMTTSFAIKQTYLNGYESNISLAKVPISKLQELEITEVENNRDFFVKKLLLVGDDYRLIKEEFIEPEPAIDNAINKPNSDILSDEESNVVNQINEKNKDFSTSNRMLNMLSKHKLHSAKKTEESSQ